MHATTKKEMTRPTLAKTVAPEDLARGDYVTLLSVDHEFPLLAWLCDPPSTQQTEVVRIRRSTDLCRDPLRVRDICLPLVFAKRPSGECVTLDVRHCELARLDAGYGRRVSKALKPKRSAKQTKKRNKKR